MLSRHANSLAKRTHSAVASLTVQHIYHLNVFYADAWFASADYKKAEVRLPSVGAMLGIVEYFCWLNLASAVKQLTEVCPFVPPHTIKCIFCCVCQQHIEPLNVY